MQTSFLLIILSTDVETNQKRKLLKVWTHKTIKYFGIWWRLRWTKVVFG